MAQALLYNAEHVADRIIFQYTFQLFITQNCAVYLHGWTKLPVTLGVSHMLLVPGTGL